MSALTLSEAKDIIVHWRQRAERAETRLASAPTDVEVEAAAKAIAPPDGNWRTDLAAKEAARAALSAARASEGPVL